MKMYKICYSDLVVFLAKEGRLTLSPKQQAFVTAPVGARKEPKYHLYLRSTSQRHRYPNEAMILEAEQVVITPSDTNNMAIGCLPLINNPYLDLDPYGIGFAMPNVVTTTTTTNVVYTTQLTSATAPAFSAAEIVPVGLFSLCTNNTSVGTQSPPPSPTTSASSLDSEVDCPVYLAEARYHPFSKKNDAHTGSRGGRNRQVAKAAMGKKSFAYRGSWKKQHSK